MADGPAINCRDTRLNLWIRYPSPGECTSRCGLILRFKLLEAFCPEVSLDYFTPPRRIPKADWDVLISQAVFSHDHRGRENGPDPNGYVRDIVKSGELLSQRPWRSAYCHR